MLLTEPFENSLHNSVTVCHADTLHTSPETVHQVKLEGLPALSISSLASEANQYLERQITRVKMLRGSIYIHPRIISYNNRSEKAYYRRIYVDAMDRDTFDVCWRAKGTQHQNVWLAAFNTYTEKDRELWHAWGVALIKGESGLGRHLLIYDCDGFDNQDESLFVSSSKGLLKLQQHLIRALQMRMKIQKLWVSCDLSKAKMNRCYQNTIDWIEDMVTHGDQKFRGENDARILQGQWRPYNSCEL
jgi:hypothetical protein